MPGERGEQRRRSAEREVALAPVASVYGLATCPRGAVGLVHRVVLAGFWLGGFSELLNVLLNVLASGCSWGQPSRAVGYDFVIRRGNVRLAEVPSLVGDLLRFAAQIELEVIPVNWVVSGTIPDYSRLLRALFEEGEAEGDLLVSRPVVTKTTENGRELLWHAIEREHIQGLVFCHHYEQWVLTWNVSRGGLLGRYWRSNEPVKLERGEFFDSKGATQPDALLESVGEFVSSGPVEVRGEFSEDHIGIHCPWRRSDVAAACDVIRLISNRSDDFEAHDDYGVWPDKDFSKWRNLAGGYAETLGASPVHPDPMDLLDVEDKEPPRPDDRD